MDAPWRIRPLQAPDGVRLSAAFAAIGWSKPETLFARYHQEQEVGDRWVRVAEIDGNLAGYVTLLWRSDDAVLRDAGVPEIVDLNVLPALRGRGIGGALIDATERMAATRGDRIGLRVGLHSGYGAAQRLYVRLGYVPDGAGALIDGLPVPEGATVPLDDEITIRMIKQLSR